MTTMTLPAPVGLPTRRGTSLGRVLGAEWRKAWGLRSTRWAVLTMVLLNVGLVYAGGSDPGVTADGVGNVASFVTGNLALSQFPLLVLGVLLGTGEFAGRSAGPTFIAVPRRASVVVAKALVTAAIAALTAVVTLALSALTVRLLGIGADVIAAPNPEAVRMWVGGGLYLVAATVFCFGLGMLVRRTMAAVIATFVIFILDFALMSAPPSFDVVTALAPGHAAHALTAQEDFLQLMRDIGEFVIDPWPSLAVTAAWALLITLLAALRVRSRDV